MVQVVGLADLGAVGSVHHLEDGADVARQGHFRDAEEVVLPQREDVLGPVLERKIYY